MTTNIPRFKLAFCALLLISIGFVVLLLHSSASTSASAQTQAVNGRIAFTNSNAIFTINPDGSNQMTVITGDGGALNGAPAWHPDGNKIAFSRRGPTEPNFGIHTINPDGTGLQRISIDSAFDEDPTWSPDGNKIAFVNTVNGDREIAVMNADGSNRVNNKQAFFVDFVTRSRFTNTFATSLTPTAFVDALFANTGITPSNADRTAAIDEFGGAGNIADAAARARALRRVAENSSFAQAEFNRAFVLMQYFGYLRRNPNDAPEPNLDFAGYNFWLNKLNQFGGNFIEAEMVKAFLSSIEYRQRFGP